MGDFKYWIGYLRTTMDKSLPNLMTSSLAMPPHYPLACLDSLFYEDAYKDASGFLIDVNHSTAHQWGNRLCNSAMPYMWLSINYFSSNDPFTKIFTGHFQYYLFNVRLNWQSDQFLFLLQIMLKLLNMNS